MTFTCAAGAVRPTVVPKALHRLTALPGTVHWGYFDATQPPALRTASGDLIQAEAVTHHAGDDPALMMDEKIWRIFNDTPEADRNPGVHIMTGPIYVEGTKPGDMLELRYLAMQPRFRHGSNLAANWGHLYREVDEKERVTIYEFDPETNTAGALYAYHVADKYLIPGQITNCPASERQSALNGVRVPARPHLGTAGVALDVRGPVSTIPPGRHGGDIDNWRIGAGSTMYYPVQVDGGLFSIGDPHISQGDGEISGTAIEASPNVLFQIVLRSDFSFPSPLLETPNNWIVHGFGADLDESMRNAAIDMLQFLTEHQGLSREDGYPLMSIASDFAVTQVVDGTQGVHVRISRGILLAKGRVEL